MTSQENTKHQTIYTEDLSIFKSHEHNVALQEKNIHKIQDSIQQKNLMHLKPIVVDSQMRVIDGQHRLEVCKRLGIGIYYIQDDAISSQDMRTMNLNQRNWSSTHFIESLAKEGDPRCLKIIETSTKYNIGICAITTIMGLRGNHIIGRILSKTYVFDEKTILEIDEFLMHISSIIEQIKPRQHGNGAWITNSASLRALFTLSKMQNFSYQRLKDSFENSAGIWSGRSKTSDYIDMYISGYNRGLRTNKLREDAGDVE